MIDLPYALVAELTHRCPLHCAYCSNPVGLLPAEEEVGAAEWERVFAEAAALGVVQIQLSGGEPLVRTDLTELVASASRLGLYVHLVTSGIGLDEERARSLAAAGLRSVQLSFQGASATTADRIAGYRAHDHKKRAAAAIAAAELPLTFNVVLHRANLDEIDAIIDLGVALGSQRIELANAQYYHWALANRNLLLPTLDQIRYAEARFRERRAELRGRVELIWVVSDYYETRPKPCMGGWGRRTLTVAPDGSVLPCPAAGSIRTLQFDSVRSHSLAWIWESSASFTAFRGHDWMPEPCRSCDLRFGDFGGCRCQAYALTGDASRTDPVCDLSADRHLVDAAISAAAKTRLRVGPRSQSDLPRFVYRNSLRSGDTSQPVAVKSRLLESSRVSTEVRAVQDD